ncbi:hypothetical protein [Luteolibacter sp. Populi]|uniref:hypothetical protein n=1 Tax=Luteolibacter sp. Populi TaxID=3230487 RepID=UPI003466185F
MVRYRNFVFAIAMGSIDTGANGDWIWMHPISWLLEDADRHDRRYLKLLRAAFDAAGAKLPEGVMGESGAPFFTLGMLIVSDWLADGPGKSEAARRLIREDGAMRATQRDDWGMASAGFLWDLQDIVSKDRLRVLKQMAAEIGNPEGDFNVECVLRSL